MKRLLLSLHVTRWLRVVAVAGVVWASAAAVDQESDEGAYSTASSASRSANAWCPRC